MPRRGALQDPQSHRPHAPAQPTLPVPPKAAANGNGNVPPDWQGLAEPVTSHLNPQALFVSESLGQTLRQLEVYGRDGLPVLSADGQRIEGWVTGASVLRALARRVAGTAVETARAQVAADWEHADIESVMRHPPAPLPGYRVIEISITGDSPGAGQKLGDIAWPSASIPVSVLRSRQLLLPAREPPWLRGIASAC